MHQAVGKWCSLSFSLMRSLPTCGELLMKMFLNSPLACEALARRPLSQPIKSGVQPVRTTQE